MEALEAIFNEHKAEHCINEDEQLEIVSVWNIRYGYRVAFPRGLKLVFKNCIILFSNMTESLTYEILNQLLTKSLKLDYFWKMWSIM